jgi:hypothetical protein
VHRESAQFGGEINRNAAQTEPMLRQMQGAQMTFKA